MAWLIIAGWIKGAEKPTQPEMLQVNIAGREHRAGGLGASGRVARKAQGGDGEASAVDVQRGVDLAGKAGAVGYRVVPLEEVCEGSLGDGTSSIAGVQFWVVGSAVGRHRGKRIDCRGRCGSSTLELCCNLCGFLGKVFLLLVKTLCSSLEILVKSVM